MVAGLLPSESIPKDPGVVLVYLRKTRITYLGECTPNGFEATTFTAFIRRKGSSWPK